ncbi:DinB family protein [Microbispora bryophytorum]|uniref:Uncharacterized protein n=1 Tax=Microbispora bryophytorum TaxID=1460882 RepID=A0A8H9H0X3_9ACTN|nr:hypothetical protein [Microbispora bryophytorum]MBD3134843.1 hypothetical protein [Microbispora bryophytorum]TQS08899.1 hypothetical protein FLX07_06615 [Microbispora bryophytorum]GGO11980.1 hypothetical protein GCM10011574_30040 [Microbispora bryophytorum]
MPADLLRALAADAVAGLSGNAEVPLVTLTAADTGDRFELGMRESCPPPAATVPVTATVPVPVHGELAEVTAYLLGRPSVVAGPPLPGWL